MKKINILSISALSLVPFALYQSHIAYELVAEATAMLAFVFVFFETQKITGRFQHLMMPLMVLLLSFLMERNVKGFPFITIALLIAVVGLIARMVFIKYFSYSRHPLLELSCLIISGGLISIQTIQHLDRWIYFAPAYIIFVILASQSYNIISNAIQLRKGATNEFMAKVGVKAPDFLLTDQFGEGVSLSDYRGKRHVLLIFVRGDWCPYCHMIMRTYMKDSQKFRDKNIMLMAIGPDPVGINRDMAKKLGLDYVVLSDEKMRVAQEYGIRLPDYKLPGATVHEEGMPLPASFLVDKNGDVIYTSRTEKIGEFLDPRLIFPIVDHLK